MIVVLNIHVMKLDVDIMFNYDHDMSHVLAFENEFKQIKYIFRNFRVLVYTFSTQENNFS